MLHRTRLTLPLLIAVLALSGCGAVSSQRAANSTYETLDADSFASALADAMAPEGSVRVSGHLAGDTMHGAYRFGDAETGAIRMSISGEEPFEMIVVDRTLYSRDFRETAWSRYSPHVFDQVLGSVGGLTPTAMTSVLEDGAEQVDHLGWEHTNGRVLHRYRVEVAREVIADRSGLRVDEVPDLTYWYWLDRSDLMHKMTAEVESQQLLEIDYHGWGEPVAIKAPPAEKVRDVVGPDNGQPVRHQPTAPYVAAS
ncbi:hypothetical protein KUV85_17000 [Nocardioides panacisoli]|uniref:hypothetical protein n=1 Tax=Nocardioides panacisoli TaxID=627624 RepID=UPI001C636AA1|nr:hypothetical protein [Nocardioides panacisoli]QYJ03998.1 hypothetical protein KUV85_17000 [Nocardioides panacisoli]